MTLSEELKQLRKRLLAGNELDAKSVAAHALSMCSVYAQAHERVVELVHRFLGTLDHMGTADVSAATMRDQLYAATSDIQQPRQKRVFVYACNYQQAFALWERMYGDPGTHPFTYLHNPGTLQGTRGEDALMLVDPSGWDRRELAIALIDAARANGMKAYAVQQPR